MNNQMELVFDAISENEGFARVAVAAFAAGLDPTLEEIADIKTAVSEAVTNAIIHGYEGRSDGVIKIQCIIKGDVLYITISDYGCGIENLSRAMEPLYTTKAHLERSGMGFAFMEAFMDDLEVESKMGEGTTVHMIRKLGTSSWLEEED